MRHFVYNHACSIINIQFRVMHMSYEGGTTSGGENPYPQWIKGIKNRDPIAWKSLIKFHERDLREDIQKSLRKRRLPLEFADDIEQDTWISALHCVVNF